MKKSRFILAVLLVVSAVLFGYSAQKGKAVKPQAGAATDGKHSGKRSTRQSIKPSIKVAAAELVAESEPKRFDEPDEALEFYRLKRVPGGKGPIPVKRYFAAMEHIKGMPQHFPGQRQLSAPKDSISAAQLEPEALGSWTELGPGNIGGRTRALQIDTVDPNLMYAAGVAGGVWKTTNGGASWVPLGDLLPNIAINSLAMKRDPAAPGDPNRIILYAGAGEGYFNGDAVKGPGIFKSVNGGATWTLLVDTDRSAFDFVNDIVFSPSNVNRLYAGTNKGVFMTVDGGATWSRVLNPKDTFGNTVTGGCLDLAIRTDTATDWVFASCGTLTQSSIYRNTDAGGAGSWNLVQSEAGMRRTSLSIAPSSQNTVYALAADSSHAMYAVFKSVDGGSSWTATVRNTDPTKLNTALLTNPLFMFYSECGFGQSQSFSQGWYDNVIAVDPVNPNIVWAGGIDLFRSDDGGANWGIASHWWASPGASNFVHADQHVIAFHPQYNGTTNKTMFVGNDGGMFRTLDARAATGTGASAVCNQITNVLWSALNNNYGVTQFYHGVPYPDGMTYFGGTQDNGTVRGSDGSGINGWGRLLGGDGGYVAVDSANTNVLYAESQRLAFSKSVDGGASFFSAISGITRTGESFLFIAPFTMDPSNSQRLWLGGTLEMWRTTDGAATWTQASATLPGGRAVTAVAVDPRDSNHVVAATQLGDVIRTNNALTSDANTVWAMSTPRLAYISWVAIDPKDSNVVYATSSWFNAAPSDRHVYKSTDGGATWAGIDGTGATGVPDVPVHTIVVDPDVSSTLYIGTDLGVFISLDGGATWGKENAGFANAPTEALTIGQVGGVTHLFAFTHGRGAWRVRTLGPVPNQRPTASISSPANGATFTAPANITINATASDPDGSVTKVDFFANGSLIGTDTTSPYSFTWTNVAAGGYALTAVATDNLGATGFSNPVNITVNAGPPPGLRSFDASSAWISVPSSNSLKITGAFTIEAWVKLTTNTSEQSIIRKGAVGDGGYALKVVGSSKVKLLVYQNATQEALTSNGIVATGGWHHLAGVFDGAQKRIYIDGFLDKSLSSTFAPTAGTDVLSIGASSDGSDRMNGLVDEVRVTAAAVYTTNFTPPPQLGNVTNTRGLWKFDDQTANDSSGNLNNGTFVGTPVFSTDVPGGGSNLPPTASITSPANGAAFNAPANITINANASDPDGSVTKVDFFANGSFIGTDTTSPYSFTWTNVAAGGYSLTAKATDNLGATGTSPSVGITVNSPSNQPPSATITSPGSGATFTAPATIPINATASDADGFVTKVDFFANGSFIGTDTTSPYSFTWTNVAAGSYSLTAVATDNLGATGTSPPVSVNVNSPANQPPSATITSPGSGATFTAPATIPINVTASDPDGFVTKVDFFANGSFIGTDTTSPYSFTWTNVVAGNYSLTAVATDNLGATGTSPSVSITVNGAPPASFSFDASSAWISVNHSSSLNITGAVTLEAWIKLATNTTEQSIIRKGSVGIGGYALKVMGSGKLKFFAYQAASQEALTSATTITTGVWHHVAGVFDGTQKRLYIDGVLDKSLSSTFAPGAGTDVLSIAATADGSDRMNGLVDEVRVTAAAVYTSNFAPQIKLGVVTGTRGLWNFDNQTANDSSGNSNHGTFIGTPVFSPDVPTGPGSLPAIGRFDARRPLVALVWFGYRFLAVAA